MTYISVIKVTVPAATKWQPSLAGQLMNYLFSEQLQPLVLVISVSAEKMEWSIEFPTGFQNSIERAITSQYPQAQIEVKPKTEIHAGYWRYPFHTTAPFIFPLRFVEDLQDIDPMSVLTEAMKALGPGERVVYELTLGLPTLDYMTIAAKDFVGVMGEIMGGNQQRLESLTVFTDIKLDSQLLEADLVVKIKSQSRARAWEMINMFQPFITLFEIDGVNQLTGAQKGETFPLVLCALEAASLWHLPSEQCQAPGIKWNIEPSLPIEELLIASGILEKEIQTLIDGKRFTPLSGKLLGSHYFEGGRQGVILLYPDSPSQVSHVHIIGRTGTGKSALLQQMINQDIRNFKGVGLIDPDGHLFKDILQRGFPSYRGKPPLPFWAIFDVTDTEYPVGLNILETPSGVSPNEVADEALSIMKNLFADYLHKDQIELILNAALQALVHYSGAKILDVIKILTDDSFRAKVLGNVDDPITMRFWDSFSAKSAEQQAQMVQPILNRLNEVFQNSQLSRIVSVDEKLDFREILNRDMIFLANLEGLSDLETEFLGMTLISKFLLAATSRYEDDVEENRLFFLYINEVERFLPTLLPETFTEARKLGLGLITAKQRLGRLENDMLEVMMSNEDTLVVFRVDDHEANALAQYMRPQFTADDLGNLAPDNSVVRMQAGGRVLQPFEMTTVPSSIFEEFTTEIISENTIRQISRLWFGSRCP